MSHLPHAHDLWNERAAHKNDAWHIDLVGKFRSPSLGGNSYIVTIIDNHSRYCMAVPTKDKSSISVLGALKKCIQDVGATPKRIYTDWGSEFEGVFSSFCTENKINMKKSCPYTAWQNGLVERCNRSVVNTAKTIMLQSGLPVEFWAHAVCTAAYTINRLSHVRLPDGITPYEAMHDKRPNISNMRVFGCHAETLVEKRYRTKDLRRS